MKILFLKVLILLTATLALIWMIWFPKLEGRAANLDLVNIYIDPLIIYGFIASIPFFVGLYQAFKLLSYIGRNEVFSQSAVNTLRNIKFSAISLIGFIALAVFYIRFAVVGDDPAGPTALGIIASFACVVIAVAAAFFQKILQEGRSKRL